MRESRVTVWIQRFNDRQNLVLRWTDPNSGARRSLSAGTADPKEAEKARADKEYELNHGRHEEASRMTWAAFRAMFEAEYTAGLRQSTRDKYVTVFDVFEQIINPMKLRNVNERTLSLFAKGMRERKRGQNKVGLAPMTMKNYLVALKTALAWAKEQNLIPNVPAFAAVRVPKKRPQPIPTESFEKLLTKAPDDLWRAFLHCGWWAGLRFAEARFLCWEESEDRPWLDFEGNRIVLPAVFAKSGEDQSVPLHPFLRQTLAALPRTGPEVFPFRSRRGGRFLTRNGITNRVFDMAKRAGVKLSMHRLPKGFGCRVAKQLGKGNAPFLHELMRHSSMQVTMDFYATVDDGLQAAISTLT